MPFLLPNQQHQSTEGNFSSKKPYTKTLRKDRLRNKQQYRWLYKKTSSHRIPEQFSVQLQLCFMFIVVSVAHEASNLLEQPQVKTPIKLVCMHPSILLLLHSLGQLRSTSGDREAV